jgi:hypothetical protein
MLKLATVKSWQAVNGPMRLARMIRGWPEMIPHQLVIRATSPLHPGTAAVQEFTGTATVESDADLWVLATSMSVSGQDLGAFIGTEGSAGGAWITPESWRATCLVMVNPGGNVISSGQVQVGHIFGHGEMPCYLPVPLILRAGAQVSIRFFSRADSATVLGLQVIRANFHGFKRMLSGPEFPVDWFLEPRLIDLLRRYRGAGQLGHVEPFVLPFNFNSLASTRGLATDSRTVTIAGSDFLGCYLTGTVHIPNGTGNLVVAPDTLLQLSMNDGARRLQDRPVNISTITGPGKRPFRFPVPLRMRSGESLTAIVTHQLKSGTDVGQFDTYLALSGVRVFKPKR